MNNSQEKKSQSLITDCKAYLARRKQEVEEKLWSLLPPLEGMAAPLHKALRYPLEAGGKRVRPILVLAGADFCRGVSGTDSYSGNTWDGVDDNLKQSLLTAACAIELVHTYSLVHDDLPCMDDDELRRGRPTSHIVFGEALAVLSSDALHTLGFQLLSSLPDNLALQALRTARELAVACGYPGMVAGQAVDLEYESKPGTEEVLEYIHLHKTAALIRASLLMGAHMVSASQEDIEMLTEVGTHLGLIFQVVDDILDVVGDTEVIGKTAGSDEARDKLTYPSLIGLDESRKRVNSLRDSVLSRLECEGDRASVLIDLTNILVDRQA